MSEESGASYKEQILDAARRNNVDLLTEILQNLGDENTIAQTINSSKDPLGNSPLHLSAQYGNYEVLDLLLDQHNVEVDPLNNLDQETPLHLAVRYSLNEPEHGNFIVEVLIEAGAEARLKNKHGEKPIDLVGDDNAQLVDILQAAEFAHDVSAQDQSAAAKEAENGDDEEAGSASSSDDDE